MKTKTKAARTVESKPTVFVVEDNDLIKNVYLATFSRMGFNVEGFNGSERNLVGAAVSRADALLLDRNLLPGEDRLAGTHSPRSGLDIACRLREKAPWVKIIIHSAEGPEPPQHMAPHDDFIEKSARTTPPEVVERVKLLLADSFPGLKDFPKSGKRD